MAKIMHKSNHETVGQMVVRATYQGQGNNPKCGPMVLFPTRIGKNLEQWLQEIHKEKEVRKQA
jgi:hypothetical protein